MIRDKHVTNAAWMTYDGENKMGRYDPDDAQTSPAYYLYDADGKRKQVIESKTANYIHGLGGELLTETSSSTITKEYAYRNGDLLVTTTVSASNAKFRWLVKDHLGTPRIVADKTGDLSAVKRHDYLPFGEEIASTAFGRDTSQGYGTPQSDGVRQQFTGYERDDESGLDFAEARMFGSSLGRFSTPDDFARDTDLGDAQSLNKYVYVRNNPLSYIDPTGEKAEISVFYDEKNKKYLIRVTASFGVYVESGKLSQKEIDKQIRLLKDQVKTAYNNLFKNGDFKFKLETSITVKQFKSEAAAKAEGDKGKIDNIVGLVEGKTVVPDRQVAGEAFRHDGENFDRLRVATKQTAEHFTYAHEFGHLLRSGHQQYDKGLMNEYSSKVGTLTSQDFNSIFTQYLDAVNRSRAVFHKSNQNEMKFWNETARARTVRAKKQ